MSCMLSFLLLVWLTKAGQVKLGTWETRAISREGGWKRMAAPQAAWLRQSSRWAVFDLGPRVFFLKRLSKTTYDSWEGVEAQMAVKLASGTIGDKFVWWHDCRGGRMTIAARSWMCIIFWWRVEARDDDYGGDLHCDGTVCFTSINWTTLEMWSFKGRNSWWRIEAWLNCLG